METLTREQMISRNNALRQQALRSRSPYKTVDALIETEELWLQLMYPDDAAQLLSIIKTSAIHQTPKIHKTFGLPDDFVDRSDAERTISSWIVSTKDESLFYAIRLKSIMQKVQQNKNEKKDKKAKKKGTYTEDNSSMIGVLGLNTRGDLIFALHPGYECYKYCTELVHAFKTTFFARMPSSRLIQATVPSDNLAAQRVLEKCGFYRTDSRQDDAAARSRTQSLFLVVAPPEDSRVTLLTYQCPRPA